MYTQRQHISPVREMLVKIVEVENKLLMKSIGGRGNGYTREGFGNLHS